MHTLSKTTPLIFQWLPKEFGNSVPNNKNYPYLQRLVNWAKREPQRDIYLVVYGPGLQSEQIQDLKDKLGPVHNIKVVDFSRIELGETDFTLPFLDKEFKLSEILQHQYSDELTTEDTNFKQLKLFAKCTPFTLILDAMRIVMLQNIEKITGRKESIYMDFDILSDANEQNLNEITIPEEILLADGYKNPKEFGSPGPFENSIIAVCELSNMILSKIISYFQNILSDINNDMIKEHKYLCYQAENYEDILKKTLVIYKRASQDAFFFSICDVTKAQTYSKFYNITEEQALQEFSKETGKLILNNPKIQNMTNDSNKAEYRKLEALYIFQENGGNVKQTQDNSWKKTNLYDTDELPLEFDSPSSDMNNSNIESKNQSEIKF